MSKNKRLVVDSSFIKNALKADLSLDEFLLMVYFDNSFNSVFDISLISEVTSLSEEKILNAYSKLLSKGIINVKAKKNDFGKISEIVSLDEFYKDIKLEKNEETKKDVKEDIFSTFESTFGRTLSGMEYEIINAWLESGFSEELILKALEEASYNGVSNLRYIDKVLFEWNKKGIKSGNDLESNLKKNDDVVVLEDKVLDYNWLE